MRDEFAIPECCHFDGDDSFEVAADALEAAINLRRSNRSLYLWRRGDKQ
jgi:hypothetical protein